MTPIHALIAQRLEDHAREAQAIVNLMEPFKEDPRWAGVQSDIALASESAQYWAKEIRADAEAPTRRPAGSPEWTPFDPEASCS